ncbi:collagen alpha-1(XV) chain [Trichonephila clavipes]|nr:collagen alpha-1(XV) chain [Trichonephila clavipes]
MYSAFVAWRYFKQPSSRKSSCEVDGREDRWKALTTPREFSLKIWVENRPNHTVTCMVLKSTTNDRCHVALCHDEFRHPRVQDLLQAIKIPFVTPGVGFVIGPDGFPAFLLEPEADIKAPYRLYLPPTLFRDFTIGVTLKPSNSNGGYVFAEEDEKGPMPTSAIKDLLKKWVDVREMILEWHSNQADVSRVGDLYNYNTINYFRKILKKREKQQPTLGMFFSAP